MDFPDAMLPKESQLVPMRPLPTEIEDVEVNVLM